MIEKIVLEHFGGINTIICRTAKEMEFYKSELERKFKYTNTKLGRIKRLTSTETYFENVKISWYTQNDDQAGRGTSYDCALFLFTAEDNSAKKSIVPSIMFRKGLVIETVEILYSFYNEDGMYRPRLFQIKNEEELFVYFSTRAGYDERYGVYTCAGIAAPDTYSLLEKLKKEWFSDKVEEATRLLAASDGAYI